MDNIDMSKFVEIVKRHFNEDEITTIVEVGSMNGEDSEYFKKLFPDATVIAYEGLKENWDKFSPSGIWWVNKVITSYTGETTFFIKNINGIHSIYDRGSVYGTETRTVPCFRLDEEILNITDAAIDMMKIDVEGATYDVFEGMGTLLDSLKIMHIETETVPYFSGQKKLHSGVSEFLISRGFTCLEIAGARISEGIQYDTVWINNEYLDS